MGHLKIRAKTINMGTVTATMHRRVERIACANAGNEPLKVSAVKGFLPEFFEVKNGTGGFRTWTRRLIDGRTGWKKTFRAEGEKVIQCFT
mgnify:CR=1 FL=1